MRAAGARRLQSWARPSASARSPSPTPSSWPRRGSRSPVRAGRRARTAQRRGRWRPRPGTPTATSPSTPPRSRRSTPGWPKSKMMSVESKGSRVVEAARLVLVCVVWLSVPLSGCVTTQVGAQGQPDGGAAGATGCADISGPVPGCRPPPSTPTSSSSLSTFPLAGTTLTSLSDSGRRHDAAAGAELRWDRRGPELRVARESSPRFRAPTSTSVAFTPSGARRFRTGPADPARRIKILNGTFAEAALLYVGTNTGCTKFAGAYGAYIGLAPTSCWQELTLDLGNPTT